MKGSTSASALLSLVGGGGGGGSCDGFFGAAAVGLIRTFFSNYRRLRSQIGLTRYTEPEMAARAALEGIFADSMSLY